jgi:hypothetical protein
MDRLADDRQDSKRIEAMANNMVEKTNKGLGLAEFIDQQIADRVQIVRDAQAQIGLLDDQIKLMKDELRELLDQKGSGWTDSVGYARLVAEGTRTAYDTKALDELILKEPLRYGWLGDFRKESTIRSGVQIK